MCSQPNHDLRVSYYGIKIKYLPAQISLGNGVWDQVI